MLILLSPYAISVACGEKEVVLRPLVASWVEGGATLAYELRKVPRIPLAGRKPD